VARFRDPPPARRKDDLVSNTNTQAARTRTGTHTHELDPRGDLDPSLVHRLEPLSLLLRILVWDGADEVVAPAVLLDLVRMRSDDDLVDQHLGERSPVF
jgi:hypothetical protein